MAETKIALYGFGSMPVVYRHLIDMAKADKLGLEWCAILTGPHYRALMREVLPQSEILDVFLDLPRRPKGGDLADLAGYVGSLTEDLAAQKRQWRPLAGTWLLDRGIDYYRMYKSFLAARGATHLLTTGIETPDGKIVIAAARELGLGILSPVDLRNLTGTMFASDALETPPGYATANPETRERAAAFIKNFRINWAPARAEPTEIDRARDDRTLMPAHLPPLGQRIPGFVRTAWDRPDLFDPVAIRVAIMNNFGWIRSGVRNVRAHLNSGKFHIDKPAQLPSRFIFYPLQYSPESSINTPAPYFVDQFRVIDALRFSMPSDCLLVVKEHWSCLEMRPLSFMRRMMRLPGVLVASSRMPARELIERAALTVSVTGTATLEAALAGRPSMTLGPALPSFVLGGPTALGDLRAAISTRADTPLPDDVLVARVASLFDARYPFFFATPHMPGEPMLRRGNLRRFLAAIVKHLERERGSDRKRMAAGNGLAQGRPA